MTKTRNMQETIGLLDQLIEAYKELGKIWGGIEAHLEQQAEIKEAA